MTILLGTVLFATKLQALHLAGNVSLVSPSCHPPLRPPPSFLFTATLSPGFLPVLRQIKPRYETVRQSSVGHVTLYYIPQRAAHCNTLDTITS